MCFHARFAHIDRVFMQDSRTLTALSLCGSSKLTVFVCINGISASHHKFRSLSGLGFSNTPLMCTLSNLDDVQDLISHFLAKSIHQVAARWG